MMIPLSCFLMKKFRRSNRRNKCTVNHIPQQISCSDRRQLVCISNHNKPCSLRNGPKQRTHQKISTIDISSTMITCASSDCLHPDYKNTSSSSVNPTSNKRCIVTPFLCRSAVFAARLVGAQSKTFAPSSKQRRINFTTVVFPVLGPLSKSSFWFATLFKTGLLCFSPNKFPFYLVLQKITSSASEHFSSSFCEISDASILATLFSAS